MYKLLMYFRYAKNWLRGFITGMTGGNTIFINHHEIEYVDMSYPLLWKIKIDGSPHLYDPTIDMIYTPDLEWSAKSETWLYN